MLLTQVAPTCSEIEGPHIYTRVLHALGSKKDEDAAVSMIANRVKAEANT